MTIRFVEEAQREFLDAISHYEEARAGLGRLFKDEVDRSILWIADHPELYQPQPVHIAASTFVYSQNNSVGPGDSSCRPKTALLDFSTQ